MQAGKGVLQISLMLPNKVSRQLFNRTIRLFEKTNVWINPISNWLLSAAIPTSTDRVSSEFWAQQTTGQFNAIAKYTMLYNGLEMTASHLLRQSFMFKNYRECC